MEQWKHQTKTWTQNPMGLVKFMFPIRMPFIYTTLPIKVYLNLITVHLVMCINMDKAKELAILILKRTRTGP
jgi:hypothetical protein